MKPNIAIRLALGLIATAALLSGCVGFGEEYTRVAGFSLDDVGAGHVFRFCLIGSDHPVAQHVHGHGLDVVRGDVGPALEERLGPRGLGQRHGAARRDAVENQRQGWCEQQTQAAG